MIDLITDAATNPTIERGARCLWHLSNPGDWDAEDERTRGLYRAAWVTAAGVLNSQAATDLFYEIHGEQDQRLAQVEREVAGMRAEAA